MSFWNDDLWHYHVMNDDKYAFSIGLHINCFWINTKMDLAHLFAHTLTHIENHLFSWHFIVHSVKITFDFHFSYISFTPWLCLSYAKYHHSQCINKKLFIQLILLYVVYKVCYFTEQCTHGRSKQAPACNWFENNNHRKLFDCT